MVLLACTVLCGCAAEKAYNEGRKAAAMGQWDEAVRYYARAASIKPRAEYRNALTVAKVKASQYHFEMGKRLKELGKLEFAVVEFREALDLDPTNQYVSTELTSVTEAIKQQQAKQEATPTEIERLKEETKTPSAPYMLNPKSNEPISLHFAKTKVKEIYTALGKAAGINILFEDGIRDTEFSIDVSGISFKKALDQIALANRHFYKILDENTIFIIPDNPTKRREYEDNIIKTFYLSNAAINDVLAMLRQILDVRKVGQNPALNSITIKDSPDKVAIAERIIKSNDKPPAEVIIDVEILEVDRQKQFNHGIDLSTYTINQVLDTGQVTGTTGTTDTTTGVTGLRLSQIDNITRDDWILTVPSLSYALFKSGGHTRFLAKPSLRALDGKQVSVRLGDQVPIETSTFTGSGAQFATRNFQFRDIGINIDITPRVHHNNEVTLVMRFEVSAVGSDPDGAAGPIPPTFGNRTVNTEIRLKDGETNLLAGLYTERGTKSRSGLPGIVDLPLLRNVFANNADSYTETDIVLTITPHIVRTPNITKEDLEPFWVGSEQTVTFSDVGLSSPSGASPFESSREEAEGEEEAEPARRLSPAEQRRERLRQLRENRRRQESGEEPPPAGEEPPPDEQGALVVPSEPGSAPGESPSQTAEQAGSEAAGEAGAATEQTAQQEAGSESPAGGGGGGGIAPPAVVSFSPASVETGVGEAVDVDIVISGARQVAHVPFYVRFDPQLIRILGVDEGGFLDQNGTRTTFMHNISPSGELIVGLSRMGRKPGVDGSGTVARIKLEGLRPGTTELAFHNAALKDNMSRDIRSTFLNGRVTVR